MSYDVGECLDYSNCKCRKLIDKLVEECSEIIDEVKIAKITSAELRLSECIYVEDKNKC